MTRSRFVMTKVTQAKYGALLGLVERHWKARGYTITSVNSDKLMPHIFGHTQDGNRISIEIGYPGNITFTAGVPYIVKPDSDYPFGYGLPQPTAADGGIDTMPKYVDPFWSH
jgi:hypothetical protein